MEREPFPARLQASAGPVTHYSPRHSPAISATDARVVGANRLGADKLRRPPRPDPKRLPRSMVIRRVEKLPLQRRNGPIDSALTPTRNTRQRIQSSSAKRGTISWQKRASKAGNQRLGIKVRCCHRRHSMRAWGRLVTCRLIGFKRLRSPSHRTAGAFIWLSPPPPMALLAARGAAARLFPTA